MREQLTFGDLLDMPPRVIGDMAAQACLHKAERTTSFDTEGAGRFIHSWLLRHGDQSGEALVDAAIEHGYRPHDARAFGGVFQRLVRHQLIECVGFCTRKRGHGTAGGRVWTATIEHAS